MLKTFGQHILINQLFNAKHHLLVAVSGGLDSMVLCHLLLKLKIPYSVAHVNFKLRGKESDEDSEFVQKFCAFHKLSFYTQTFATKSYAKEKKISVQMAARELRYEFFENLREKHGFDFIVTAHHLSDAIETYLINLIRGTGIDGMTGISMKNSFIVRPMLPFKREDIENYAKSNKINYREDSSNQEDKYMRNYLRLHIIPKFKDMNPAFEESLKKQLSLLEQYNLILKKYIQSESEKIVSKKNNATLIHIKNLLNTDTPELILFELLKPFKFNAKETDKILKSCHGISGKLFYSPSHKLSKDRVYLIIEPLNSVSSFNKTLIHDSVQQLKTPIQLNIKTVAQLSLPVKTNEIYVDKAKLTFPLLLRPWQKGDKLKPFGMKGSKKVSDLFSEFKLNDSDKSKLLILENATGEIIWVVNLKVDDRFKVTNKTKEILKLETLEK